ncbi:MAG: NADPH-dependent FMN reductase, partial [Erythrobacteraceae bacterium]
MTRIVALGGTVNPGSSTEQALRLAASIAGGEGAEVTVFGGEYLTALPHYLGPLHYPSRGAEMVAAVRAADGLLIAAPGYHGTISGVVKNALVDLDDLARAARPSLDGRAGGLIAPACG